MTYWKKYNELNIFCKAENKSKFLLAGKELIGLNFSEKEWEEHLGQAAGHTWGDRHIMWETGPNEGTDP